MAGAMLQVEGKELERLQNRLERFMGRVTQPAQGLKLIAAALESQTKERIVREKRDSEGRDWKQWSEKYKRTRDANKSLLRNKDHLLQDIAADSDIDSATVFTTLDYGRTHQVGDDTRNIPARPFLGLSRQNALEIEEIFTDWIERQL